MKFIESNKEAIAILTSGEPLLFFNGPTSEWGPRALGFRSILFDPTHDDAKHIVNKFKKREWWRPLAGTVLFEKVHDYFDLGGLEESPYMSFAVEAKQLAKDKVPSIVHVDNTCRIQTLKKDFNVNYYNLINDFYEKTGVPILLNTSLNIAGFPIVETIEHLWYTFNNSEFKYILYKN